MVIELDEKKNKRKKPTRGQSEIQNLDSGAKVVGFPVRNFQRNRDSDQATAAILERAKSLKW